MLDHISYLTSGKVYVVAGDPNECVQGAHRRIDSKGRSHLGWVHSSSISAQIIDERQYSVVIVIVVVIIIILVLSFMRLMS